jgi:DNA-binding HxlR family transcriptional regulator
LPDRLAHLESGGIISRHRDPERGNQVICELPEKGVALVPMFLAMIDWSATYDAETEAPAEFVAGYRADPAALAQELARTLSAAHRPSD